MTASLILLEIRDGVAHLTFNRPEAANSMNVELVRELVTAVERIADDPSARAVLVRGAGTAFSAGGDVKSFAREGENLSSYLRDVASSLHLAIGRLTRLEIPVVAAVHGAAAGAGMSFACACDLVVAAESSRFTMAYTRLGFTPDGGSTVFLARIVGARRALELVLSSRMLSAKEACDLGIVTEVVPDDRVFAEAEALASTLASGPTLAFRGAKRLLLSGWSESLETQLESETREIAASGRTADGREGVAAFVEKRAPRFRGA